MQNCRIILLILQVVALMSCRDAREEKSLRLGESRSIAVAIIVNFSLFYERLNGGFSLLEAKLLRDLL